MPVLSSSTTNNAPCAANTNTHSPKLFFLSHTGILTLSVIALLLLRYLFKSRAPTMTPPSSSSTPKPELEAEAKEEPFSDGDPATSEAHLQAQNRPYAPPIPWTTLRASWNPPPPRPTLQLERDLSFIANEVREVTQSPSYVQSFREAPLAILTDFTTTTTTTTTNNNNNDSSSSSSSIIIDASPTPALAGTYQSNKIPETGRSEWEDESRRFADQKSEAAAMVSASEVAADSPPVRRRSYTTSVEGSPVLLQGEIMTSPMENWTRHTRVYGGEVCLACLESEEKMRS